MESSSAERSELSLSGAFWIVCVLVVGAFAPALAGGFLVLDDEYNFVLNAGFRGLSGAHLRWMFTTDLGGNWQPLSWLSYGLDHVLWGLDAPRYHQVSVLWHVAVAALFLLVAERLFRRVPGLVQAGASGARAVRLAALLATLVFAIHPLRAESVAWVTGRNDVVAGLFFLLALLAWLRYTRADAAASGTEERAQPKVAAAAACALLAAVGVGLALAGLELPLDGALALAPRGGLLLALAGAALVAAVVWTPRALGLAPADARGKRLAYALAWLAAGLSLLGKAYGVVLPALLLVLDVWPLGRLARLRAVHGGTPRALVVLAAEKLPFVALSVLCARITTWAKAAGDLRTLEEHTLAERAWQAGYGLAFYARKMLVPSGLSPMYDLPDEIRLSEPRFLFSCLAVVVLGALLWRGRARAPGALWVALSYALLIAPALGVMQTGAQLVADRYSYLACMPLALGLGGLALRLAQRGPAQARAALAGGVTLVLVFGVATWRASARWADPVALFEHGIAVSDSPRLMTNLAMTYNQAAAFDPERREALLEEALAWSERAVRTAEERRLLVPMYRLHRGTIRLNLGRLQDAVSDLAWFVERQPERIDGHLNLGLALERGGQPALAVQAFERTVALAPELELAWRGLGAASEASGDPQRAIVSYRRALALAPGHPAVEARLRALESR